ncbi:MAG: ABC transporter permease subunit [Tissierellales bacterium]|jgi:phosphonate transport system permease protein|nr:ABC transporter permease subunit [Tissierellales bacterium]HCX04192.1 phosphonate ABC transporter permease [Clostridiales bacterium]
MSDIKISFTGKPKIKTLTSADIVISAVIIVFILITVYTVFFNIEYKWDDFQDETALDIASNFIRFDKVGIDKIIEMLLSLINTLSLAFVTTITGFVTGIVFGLLSARNISNLYLSNLIRGTASLIRAVPTIIWVLIFVSGYGLSATTAVMGMFFHTLSFFIKSFAETFEEVDKGTIEALRASGSNWLQIVFGTILPSSLTKIISWIAIRSEINFGVAVVIGPAAGVPGTIGSLINNASRGGDYATQGFGVILVFLTAYIMEVTINNLRQKSIIN